MTKSKFPRSKIAVVHPKLTVSGGSEATAAWTLNALQDDHDVTLITTESDAFSRLNAYYGTQIDPNRIQIRTVPIFPLFKKRFDALRYFNLVRYCRKSSSKFDIMISAYNAMDFGKKGIQIIGDFSFDDKARREFYSGEQGWLGVLHKESLLRKMYLSTGRILSGSSAQGWKNNLTVSCSAWCAEILKRIYGLESRVIYSPVRNRNIRMKWNERSDGFVFMGRLAPEKGTDKVIAILDKVRQKGHDIHLHILGGHSNTAYSRKVIRLCEAHSEWCHFEGYLSTEEKNLFLDQHKYGISGCRNEAFGIAVAEMVQAGCIVWVPKSGGQMEIVQQESLMYMTPDEAVDLIHKMLKNKSLQKDCQKKLIRSSKRFSTERFMSEMQTLIQDFLEGTCEERPHEE